MALDAKTGHSAELGFEIGAHALRATAATNALDHQSDIAKVQEWLGHANIAPILAVNLERCLRAPTVTDGPFLIRRTTAVGMQA